MGALPAKKASKRKSAADKGKVALEIRRYKYSEIEIQGVRIGVLVLQGSKKVDASGDPLEVLMSAVEELGEPSPGELIEIRVSDGRSHIVGEWSPPGGEAGVRLLYPRPVRLLAAGVLRVSDIVRRGESEGAMFRLGPDVIRLKQLRSTKVYVYEGPVIVSGARDAYLLILDTEAGRRIVRLASEPIVEKLVQHVLTPPEQDSGGHSSGRAQGGDSSPSS